MKLSVTLSKQADRALGLLAEEHHANHSTITEAALMRFFELPPSDREHFLRGIQATKKAYTKGRWRAAFWDAMRDEFWIASRLRTGRQNDFAPLTFVGFQVWFLLDSLNEPDSEAYPFFNVQTMSNPMESRFAEPVQRQFTFPRDRSPYDAAREVATFMRELATKAGTFEIIALSNDVLVSIDHSGAHWMSQPEIDPALLPLAVSGKHGTYNLERDFRFTQTSPKRT